MITIVVLLALFGVAAAQDTTGQKLDHAPGEEAAAGVISPLCSSCICQTYLEPLTRAPRRVPPPFCP